jgi:dynein light intermediate chain 1
MSEQVFLTKHYDENAKKSDRDPRGAFRTPGEAAAGVVGPLGSSSFSLPTVERALKEMDGATNGPAVAAPVPERKRTTTAGRPPLGSSASSSSRPGSTAPPNPTSPGGGQPRNEVLHNFFQSLLTSKDRAGASAAVSKAQVKPTADATAGANVD